MADTPIRLRVAPSPTGEPHIGTAYVMLFNVMLARQLGGEVILRIEDTDQKRSTPEAETKLMEALNWLGMEWVEGPDKGGECGPYRQSERKELYQPYVQQLIDDGHAFKCYCTPERLDLMRKAQRQAGQATKYDGRCMRLSDEERAQHEKDGTPHVVRMKIPTEGDCTFHDGVHGEVSIPYEGIDMQVLLKADGMPTYHMANVIDDHLMGITHVARGEEWLSSVPKHVLLYQYFGWEAPKFYHLPLMRNLDRSKLSKRRNPTSLSYFSGVGYLPQALLNYLGLFFVTVAEGEEVMDMSELDAKFDPEGLAKAGAVFDIEKLGWLNGRWLRERLSAEEFAATVVQWAAAEGKFNEVLEMARSRVNVLGELPALAGFMFANEVTPSREAFEKTKIGVEGSLEVLKAFQPHIDTLGHWTSEELQGLIRTLGEEQGRKMRDVVQPLFLTVTGSARSLPLFDSMATLGRSLVRQRVNAAIKLLSS